MSKSLARTLEHYTTEQLHTFEVQFSWHAASAEALEVERARRVDKSAEKRTYS
jgi:hypothetical protein